MPEYVCRRCERPWLDDDTGCGHCAEPEKLELPKTYPYDSLPEEQKTRLWDAYMDWEKSALVEQILTGMTQKELEDEIALMDELTEEEVD